MRDPGRTLSKAIIYSLLFGLLLSFLAGIKALYGMLDYIYDRWRFATVTLIIMKIGYHLIAIDWRIIKEDLDRVEEEIRKENARKKRTAGYDTNGYNTNKYCSPDTEGTAPPEYEPIFKKEQWIGDNGEFDIADEFRAAAEDLEQMEADDPNFNAFDSGYDWDIIMDAYNDGYIKNNPWKDQDGDDSDDD